MSADLGEALLASVSPAVLGCVGSVRTVAPLPFTEPRKQHDLAIGELKRVMIDLKHALVDLAKIATVLTDSETSGDKVSLAAKPPAMAAIDQAAGQPRAICDQSRLCRLRCAKRRSST
jgi:hypothetical protein